MRCTSLVIADRHPVVLQGLTNVLGAQDGLKVIACCSDGRSCIEAIRSFVPDIAILDFSMPGLTSQESSPSPIPRDFPRGWSFLPNLCKSQSWSWRRPPAPTVSFRRT
jgi:CheY-like chemotaxis protein